VTADKLKREVSSVDWNALVGSFDIPNSLASELLDAAAKLAVWATEIEKLETNEESLAFVREAQVQMHHAIACTVLGLYKPGAAAMRAIVESCLYYTFFRSHPAELSTLVRDPKYYVDKTDIIEFHRLHTPDFAVREQAVNFVQRLTVWYSTSSAVAHGQIPGRWLNPGYEKLADLKHDAEIASEVSAHLVEGLSLSSNLFLVTLTEYWPSLAVASKRSFMKGLSPTQRTTLGLKLA
jgi:hypothetical protein